MELEKQMRLMTGSKVAFKAFNAAYERIIFFVTRQATLFKDVYILPNRQHVGNLTVAFGNMKSYDVVEFAKPSQEKNYGSKSVGSNEGEDFTLKLPPQMASELPNDYVLLNAVNSEFHQAIDHIVCQSTIGVSLDGDNVTRAGHLSWITIGTPSCMFLFDIHVLGQQAFDKGLRDIFQNKDIEKVMYDCRQSADTLKHSFSTDIINVFDTQVADYIVNMQQFGNETITKKVSSLDSILLKYLQVPKEFLYNQIKYQSYNCDDDFFGSRPVRNECLNILVKNALYLISLKEKLTELLLNPFQRAVDDYLNVYTNMCEAELVLETADSNENAPKILTHNLQKVEYCNMPLETNVNPFKCYFKHPQTGEIIGVKNNSTGFNSFASLEESASSVFATQDCATQNMQETKSASHYRSCESTIDSNNSEERVFTGNLEKGVCQDVPVEANIISLMSNCKNLSTRAIIDVKNGSKRNQSTKYNSVNVSNLEESSVSVSHDSAAQNVRLTESLHNRASEANQDFVNLHVIRKLAQKRRSEHVRKIRERSNRKLNTPENLSGVQLPNNNSCKNSNSSIYNEKIETVQINHMNAKIDHKFILRNKLNVVDKSTTNISEALIRGHKASESVCNVENFTDNSKLCFVPSGME